MSAAARAGAPACRQPVFCDKPSLPLLKQTPAQKSVPADAPCPGATGAPERPGAAHHDLLRKENRPEPPRPTASLIGISPGRLSCLAPLPARSFPVFSVPPFPVCLWFLAPATPEHWPPISGSFRERRPCRPGNLENPAPAIPGSQRPGAASVSHRSGAAIPLLPRLLSQRPQLNRRGDPPGPRIGSGCSIEPTGMGGDRRNPSENRRTAAPSNPGP